MKGEADEDAGGEADKGAEEAGEAGTDHAVDAGEVFGGEVADGEGALGMEYEDAAAFSTAAGEAKAEDDEAGKEEEEGAVGEGGEEGVLPFEIGGERVGVGGPEEDGEGGEDSRAGEGEDDKQDGEQAVALAGLADGIKDGGVWRGFCALYGVGVIVLAILCISGLYHKPPVNM